MKITDIIILISGFIILFIGIFIKYNNFLNINSIITEHLSELWKNKIQFVSIFFAPILISYSLAVNRTIDESLLSSLNVILSILTAMFFSILGVLCTIKEKTQDNEYKILIEQTFNSTVFEILLCLLLLLISFTVLFVNIFERNIFIVVSSGIIYYLTIIMIVNILMIIKRMKILFEFEKR